MDTDLISFLKENRPVLTLLLPFSTTLFLLPHLVRLASRIGLVDYPNKRKVHQHPKPLVGGIAMSLAIALTGLLFIPLSNLRGFYAGLVLLVVAGFLDDFGELHHRVKFLVQVIAAGLVIFFGRVYLHTFGDLLGLGPITFSSLAIPVTIVSIVGLCNALNMIDGIDGLAGGVSLTAFGSFAFLSFLSNQTTLMLLNIAICGSLVAFLVFNWHPAKLFMGDAGSLFLGFSAGFVSIALTQGQESTVRPVVPLLIMSVPIVDTVTLMTKRLLKKKNPFRADNRHLHHILIKLGYTKKETTMIIIALCIFFSSLAIAGTLLSIPDHYLFFFFVAYSSAYFIASFYLKELIRKRSKLQASFRYSAVLKDKPIGQ